MTYADECLERAHKATEGPWRINAISEYVLENEEGTAIGCLGGYDRLVQNGDFIAKARTDVPELARRLKEACEKLREIGEIVPLFSAIALADSLESSKGIK